MKKKNLFAAILLVALFVLFSCSENSTEPDNTKPSLPYNPNPEYNATDVSITPTLYWECIDPEEDSLFYDIYFGTNHTLGSEDLISNNQNSNSYELGLLHYETNYYWKIVAKDGTYETEGDVWMFTTSGAVYGTVVDIDGNFYQTIVIGNKEWMTENLKVTHYKDGSYITYAANSWSWLNCNSGAYCYYDNEPNFADQYGILYNWEATNSSRGLAPEGWNIPSDEEIKELEIYLGMNEIQADSVGYRGTNEGSKLAGGYPFWLDGALRNNSEFDTSCFGLIPSGFRTSSTCTYYGSSQCGGFWTSTGDINDKAWTRRLDYNNTTIKREAIYKEAGYSVRCVRDLN